MAWRNRKKPLQEPLEKNHSYIEVVKLQSKTTKTINQTKRDIKTLNDLLKVDGITLKIHIATRTR